MNQQTIEKHYCTCNLCEATCGIVIEHQNHNILSIKGDKDDPFSRGFICPKAVALQDIYSDPDRLKKPVKKSGDSWVEISWDEAYEEVASNIIAIQQKYGNDSVALYLGNPTVHSYGAMLFNRAFKKVLHTKNNYSATSIDQLPHHLVAQAMFGHSLMIPVPDLDRTDYLLILGGNPLVSNGSMMTAPGMINRLSALKSRNGKTVVIDPRKTETANKADKHLFITPGSDVYFLASLIHEILNAEQKVEPRVPDYADGFELLQNAVVPFSSEKTSRLTGIEPKALKTIAKEFRLAEKAVCYGRLGVSTQIHGTLCQWLINVLNIVTDNFDKAGGHMFTSPAVQVRFPSSKKASPLWYSRVKHLPEVIGELPVATLAEEMATPGDGQIKAFVCSAGNPVLSTPHGNALNQSLKELDFMVSIDIYINETSRHANIILPPATGLETDHYDLVFNSLAVRNVAKFSPAFITPEKGMHYDWQIFHTLTNLLRKNKLPLFSWLKNKWITPQRLLNLGLKRGPYGNGKQGLSLNKLKQNVHGIDLGPLMPAMPEGLFTENKRLILAPSEYIDALGKLKITGTPSLSEEQYLLIGRRHLRSNNSWMHNSNRLVKGPTRCTAIINKKDAESIGIAQGAKVRVTSTVGMIELPVEITDDIKQGVISIPHGWGHNKDIVNLSVAQEVGGVSINDLIDNQMIDKLSGTSVLSGVPVTIEPILSSKPMQKK